MALTFIIHSPHEDINKSHNIEAGTHDMIISAAKSERLPLIQKMSDFYGYYSYQATDLPALKNELIKIKPRVNWHRRGELEGLIDLISVAIDNGMPVDLLPD